MQPETIIPLFSLGLVLLPQMPLPLHIFEERYKLMIGECLDNQKTFGVVYFNGSDIQTIGCTARILKIIKRYDDGRLDILTHGEDRFIIKEIIERTKITSEIRKIIGGNGDMAKFSSKSIKIH